MTGRDRVVAAYKGGYADRVPAYPITGSFAGCLDGLSIEEYCTNPTKAVRAMLNYYERYEPDIMIAFNLTSLSRFGGRTIDDLPNVLAYVERIAKRPAYAKAMQIAGPAATRPGGSR